MKIINKNIGMAEINLPMFGSHSAHILMLNEWSVHQFISKASYYFFLIKLFVCLGQLM